MSERIISAKEFRDLWTGGGVTLPLYHSPACEWEAGRYGVPIENCDDYIADVRASAEDPKSWTEDTPCIYIDRILEISKMTNDERKAYALSLQESVGG